MTIPDMRTIALSPVEATTDDSGQLVKLRLQLSPTCLVEIDITAEQDRNHWGRKIGYSYIYTKLDPDNVPLWQVTWTVIGPDEYQVLSAKSGGSHSAKPPHLAHV